jgi:hypothetical protein
MSGSVLCFADTEAWIQSTPSGRATRWSTSVGLKSIDSVSGVMRSPIGVHLRGNVLVRAWGENLNPPNTALPLVRENIRQSAIKCVLCRAELSR